RDRAAAACNRPELQAALDGASLRQFAFKARPLERIYQFDTSRGATGFPKQPQDVLNKAK
ncbi:MAG: hypothetical protein M1608_02520, partial [Candidatus Omnitrophica bacterium]|nr:hypothetical protein [Candidatus Omnitrophota bacterium]